VNNLPYDVVIFHSYKDTEEVLKWFKRMKNVLIDEIGALESCLNSIESEADRNSDISNVIKYMINRKDSAQGSGDSDIQNDEGVKPPLVLGAVSILNESSLPSIEKLMQEVLDKRVKSLDAVNNIISRIGTLKEDIWINGRAVVLIIDSLWSIFGTRYLFSPIDAKEYFLMKGEISNGPFGYYDPYFSSVYGATFGNLINTVQTL
jgi:hypothetical protein